VLPPPAGPAPGGTAARPTTRPPTQSATPWTTGRVLALAFGTLVLLVSLGFGIAGATLAFADSQLRDDAGFLMSGDQPVATQTYAVVSQDVELHSDVSWLPEALLGDAKVTATSSTGDPVFVGVASSADVVSYLGNVEHVVVTDLRMNGDLGDPTYRTVPGVGTPGAPAAQDFWVAQASGTGTQSIQWTLESGTYTVVVMDPGGGTGVFADVAAGVTVPGMSWVVGVLLSLAGTGLIIAIALLLVAFHNPSPQPGALPPTGPATPGGGPR
jgi:hypothetical protein